MGVLETIILLNTGIIVVNTYYLFINSKTIWKVIDQHA